MGLDLSVDRPRVDKLRSAEPISGVVLTAPDFAEVGKSNRGQLKNFNV